MGNVISEAEVKIGLNDSGLIADLKSAEAAVDRTYAKIDGKEARPEITLDRKQFDAAVKEIQAELFKLEKQRTRAIVHLDVEGATKAQLEIDKLKAKAEILSARRYDIKIGVDKKALTWVQQLGDGMGSLNKKFSDMKILNVPVHFFNLTLRLKQLIAAFAIALPMIVSLGGALTSIVSVIGLGLVGVLAGATAGLGAFLAGFAGAGAVLIPVVSQLKQAAKASKEYNTAVTKFGKDSIQARNRMEQLRHVMGNVSPETARVISSFGKLGKEWSKLAKPGRATVFNTMAEGIKTARADMQIFAREGVQSLNALGTGTRDWLKQLRSSGAQGVFKSLSDGFQATLPGIMASLANIASGIAHIAVAAQPMFASFVGWLKNWSQGFRDATGDTSRMADLMGALKSSAAALGRVFGATGRLVWAVMRAGAKSGEGLLDSLTGILDKWTAWINANPAKVQEFFADSADMAKKIVTGITQIVQAFWNLGQATAPAASLFLSLLNTFLKLKAIVVPMAAAFASIWAVNKVLDFIVAVNRAKGAIMGLAVAQKIAAALPVVPIGGIRGGKAQKTKYPIGMGTRFAAGVAGGVAAEQVAAKGVTAIAGSSVAAVAGLTAMATAAVAVGFAINKWQGDKIYGNLHKMAAQYNKDVAENLNLQKQLPGSIQAEKSAVAAMRKAREDYNKARNPQNLRALDAAEAAASQARETRARQEQQTQTSASRAVIDARRRLAQATVNSALKDDERNTRELVAAQRDFAFALDRSERSTINMSRAQAGLQPILGAAGMKMGEVAKKLSGISKTTFKNFVAKVDFSSAVKATNAMARLQKLGGTSAGIKILADTKNPEQAIRRVQLLADKLTQSKKQVFFGANVSQASRNISSLQLKALGLTRKQYVAMIKANANTSQLTNFARKLFGIPTKRETKLSTPGALNAINQAQQLGGAISALPTNKQINVKIGVQGNLPSLKAKGGRVAYDEDLTIVNEEGPEAATFPDGKTRMLSDGRPSMLSLEPGTFVHTAAQTIRLLRQAGMDSFAKGGTKKKQKQAKQLKSEKRSIAKVAHSNDADLKAYKPYQQYRSAEAQLKVNQGKYDQNVRAFNIDARSIPLTDKDGNVIPENVSKQSGRIQKLIDEKTNDVLQLQRTIAALTHQIIAYINKNLMSKWDKEEAKVHNLRKKGKLSKAGEQAAISAISKRKSDLRGTRGEFQERQDALGDDSQGEIRDSLLDIADLRADQNDVNATSGNAASGAAGPTDIADQANARASAAERAAAISEAAFRVFRGAGDIGFGGGSALGAAMGGAVSTAFSNAVGAGAASTGASNSGGSAQPQNVFNINTLHPGDSRTLTVIAQASNAGNGLSGFQQSPREALAI